MQIPHRNHRNRAAVYALRSHYDCAIIDYDQVLKLNPAFAGARENHQHPRLTSHRGGSRARAIAKQSMSSTLLMSFT